MNWLIKNFFCRWFKHKWRKPHNGEVANSRYCRRCGDGRAVRARKPKLQASA